jgi:hypothetical protein
MDRWEMSMNNVDDPQSSYTPTFYPILSDGRLYECDKCGVVLSENGKFKHESFHFDAYALALREFTDIAGGR